MNGSAAQNIFSYGPKAFVGKLAIGGREIDVDFEVSANAAGDMKIAISRFPYNSDSKFIKELHYELGTNFSNYTLFGGASDGSTFKCDNVIFTSLREEWSKERGSTMEPVAHYSYAEIVSKCDQTRRPTVTWRIKRFEGFAPLSASSELGEIHMVGVSKLSEENELSGKIAIVAPSDLDDLNGWQSRADGFCDHVRDVMSLASGTYLLCPVREFFFGDTVRISLYSQGPGHMPETAAFKSLHLNPIFQCAVRSFFEPSIKVNNLKFAIKWFLMRSEYAETTLITSMTVLENLLDSNLSPDDVLIMDQRRLKKLKKKLREVIRADLKEWVEEPSRRDELLVELDGRLVDLKRKSLFEKLMLLAERWGVLLDDIPSEEIRQAKTARDHVVHRGYYERSDGDDDSVYECVLTVRELVVRFLLTVLGFDGEILVISRGLSQSSA